MARAVLKYWFGEPALGRGEYRTIKELVDASETGDFLQRRKLSRQFEAAAERIGAQLIPYFESEYGGLPEGEREAAAFAVAMTLDTTPLSQEMLLAGDLNPVSLEEYLRSRNPTADNLLSAAGSALYNFTLRESCNYIIELATTLPRFSGQALAEVLERETEIIELVKSVLDQLPRALAGDAGESETAMAFETQYRREIARTLDQLELFGLTVSALSRRYQLSVAYMTLSATGNSSHDVASQSDLPRLGGRKGKTQRKSRHQEEETEGYLTVDEALSGSQRVLIRGEAGSGKTTLLQWIAVAVAREACPEPLSALAQQVPFLISLRRYFGSELPRPEEFLAHTAPQLIGLMPQRWVHEKLSSGQALILIDGVDEVPERQRRRVKEWLDQLTHTFPESTYWITSRPPAVSDSWLEESGFEVTDLLPMTVADVFAFVDHWYAAAASGLSDEDVDRLDHQRDELKTTLRDAPQLRNLATTPLLCAMLCALNRDRKAQLPRDRLQLYKIALDMLLERRDVERDVRSHELQLTLSEKEILLMDLAHWLMVNGRSSASDQEVLDGFARRVRLMPHVTASPSLVFDYMLVRSGVLRSPVPGNIDFIHRTFQEYFAASEAVEQNNVGLLVKQAHLDQWAETVVLAAGLAPRQQREVLISDLLARGDREIRYRHRLHLLAVACLETSPELSPRLTRELATRLEQLVPPRNLTEAKALASAGSLAAPLLDRGPKPRRVARDAASVRALSLIGGDRALDAISTYAADQRVTVVRELIRAWSNFRPDEYAERVLAASMLLDGSLELRDPSLLYALRHLRNLRRLVVARGGRVEDLKFLNGCESLETVQLRNFPSVTGVDIPNDVAQTLTALSLEGFPALESAEGLATLRRLRGLRVSRAPHLWDFSALTDLSDLRDLWIIGSGGSGLDLPLASLRKLRQLHVATSFDDIEGKLAALDELRRVWLGRSVDVRSLEWMPSSSGLSEVTLWSLEDVTDLDLLMYSTKLRQLSLRAPAVADITGLSSLSLTHLALRESSRVEDFSPISRLVSCTWLDLSGCSRVSDLGFLRPLQQIRYLYLRDCLEIETLAALAELPRLEYVDVTGCREDLDLGGLQTRVVRRRVPRFVTSA